MADCLKCGFNLAENQSVCPRSGVILAKARPARAQPALAQVPIIADPVPHAAAVTELRGDATKLRVFAMMIDNVAAAVVFIMAMKLLFVLSGEDADYTTESAIGCMAAVIPAAFGAFAYLLYFFVQEGIWGTTLGKLVFGLRVARLDGKPVGLWEAWWRTLLRVFEVNPLLLGAVPGGFVMMWSRRRQRIGDMMAGTVVVSRKALASAKAESAD